MKYFDQRLCISVCFSVCLSACILSQKSHVQHSPNFLYTLPVAAVQLFFDGSVICCVLPVLWMTLFSHNGGHWAQIKHGAVSLSSPGGGTSQNFNVRLCLFQFIGWRLRGAKLLSVVYNCSKPFTLDLYFYSATLC